MQRVQQYVCRQRGGGVHASRSVPTHATILINTLPTTEQECVLTGTLSCEEELTCINRYIENNDWSLHIYVYGRNCSDTTVLAKYNRLRQYGFTHVHMYVGGLFEWLLLQELLGSDVCRTTTRPPNLLHFSSNATGVGNTTSEMDADQNAKEPR
jgi:hypothetical protein